MARSSLTLPVVFVSVAILWLLPGVRERELWFGLFGTGVTAYLMIEWNNRHALLRVRSQLTSSTFLVLSVACPFLHRWTADMLLPTCLAGAYFLLFSSYQKVRAEGETFHAFLCIGLGSLLFPPIVVVVPFLYFSMILQMRSFSLRSFLAGCLGLLLPYWMYMGWAVWHNRLDEVLAMAGGYVRAPSPDYAVIGLHERVSLVFVIALVLISVVHYLRTAYNDKIRTRMFFYVLIIQVFLLISLLALFPQWHSPVLRLLLVPASPLIGHYLALARGRFMNAWFILILLSAGALAAFNYCEDGCDNIFPY